MHSINIFEGMVHAIKADPNNTDIKKVIGASCECVTFFKSMYGMWLHESLKTNKKG